MHHLHRRRRCARCDHPWRGAATRASRCADLHLPDRRCGAHRALLARVTAGADTEELAERALLLVGTVVAGLAPKAVAAGFPTQRRAERVVDQVRQAVAADPGLRLADLARVTELSPYHLSRLFHRSSGVTISRLRTRLKVRQALDRLADGQRDLAALAAEAGFADQAHLTRTVRRETGRTPGQLRALLAPSGRGNPGSRTAASGPPAASGKRNMTGSLSVVPSAQTGGWPAATTAERGAPPMRYEEDRPWNMHHLRSRAAGRESREVRLLHGGRVSGEERQGLDHGGHRAEQGRG